jgi:hypothetical protein
MKRPVFLYLLLALLLFLGIGGLFGGGMLIIRPDGTLLGMQAGWLDHSPFNNYLFPGLVLFVINGLFPLFAFVGLIFQPDWQWANVLNIYSKRHWAWTYSLYSGIIIIAWISFQLIWTQYFWLQPLMIFIGLLILICALTPSVMRKYETL